MGTGKGTWNKILKDQIRNHPALDPEYIYSAYVLRSVAIILNTLNPDTGYTNWS